MAFNWKVIRSKLYGILEAPERGVTKVKMYDERGNRTIDPLEANRFFATYKSHDPNLESLTLLVATRDRGQTSHIDIKTPEITDDRDFDTILGLVNHIKKSVGQKEGITVNWQDFDKAIDPREEAVNNIKESKDVSKIFGTTKSSFQRIGEAKLIIRHTDTVNEEKHGARTRHIRAIFVENKIGERFAYPHLHMAGARAFARHISNGGTNHDGVASKIFSLSEDYISLRRSGAELRLHEGSVEWVGSIRECMNSINKRLKSMHGPKGYGIASQELLGESESVVIDEKAVSELHAKLAECCGCDDQNPRYADFGRAARYITGMPRMTKPMVFTWSRRPDMAMNMTADPAQRMYNQIMELADACSNEDVKAKLEGIAEMISCGTDPSDQDFGFVKEAFASGIQHEPTETPVQEEAELDEFFAGFTPESIFSEDSISDKVSELEAEGEDSTDAEQEANDEVSEWETDPDEEQAQRAEAVEANIEYHLETMGITAAVSEPDAIEIADKIEAMAPGISSDEVLDYLEKKGMLIGNGTGMSESELRRLSMLAGL